MRVPHDEEQIGGGLGKALRGGQFRQGPEGGELAGSGPRAPQRDWAWLQMGGGSQRARKSRVVLEGPGCPGHRRKVGPRQWKRTQRPVGRDGEETGLKAQLLSTQKSLQGAGSGAVSLSSGG